jgi:hypothetical protein
MDWERESGDLPSNQSDISGAHEMSENLFLDRRGGEMPTLRKPRRGRRHQGRFLFPRAAHDARHSERSEESLSSLPRSSISIREAASGRLRRSLGHAIHNRVDGMRGLFKDISRVLNQIQPPGFRHDVKLDKRRLVAHIHEDEQAPVVLGAKMA